MKAFVDKAEFEKMADEMKAEYTETEGGHLLKVEAGGGYTLEKDVDGLKSALGKERANVRDAQSKLKTFEGIEDPAAAIKAMEKLAELGDDPDAGKKAQAKLDALKDQLNAAHEAVVTEKDSRIDFLTGKVHEYVVDAVAIKAITDLEGSPTLLLPHVKKAVKVREVDNDFLAEVQNPDGTPKIGDTKGTPMSIVQHVEEMKGMAEFAGGFKGSGASGSGKPGDAGGKGTPPGGTPGSTVARTDQDGLNANIEGIAKGEVQVTDS